MLTQGRRRMPRLCLRTSFVDLPVLQTGMLLPRGCLQVDRGLGHGHNRMKDGKRYLPYICIRRWILGSEGCGALQST